MARPPYLILLGFLFTPWSWADEIPQDANGFTEYVAARLKKEIGEANVAVKGPLTLGVGDLQANLDRIYDFCRRDREGCDLEIDRYVRGVEDLQQSMTTPANKDAVRIVLRTRKYIQAAQASLGGDGLSKVAHPFVEGLFAVPVLDTPRSVRSLVSDDAQKLGLSAEGLYQLGMANVQATLKPLWNVAKPAGHRQIGSLTGDIYQPTRLLFHDEWKPLAMAQGGVLIVVAPTTDAVFYISEDAPDNLDAFRTFALNVMKRAPNQLSSTLLRWTESGWEVVGEK